ncbi:MAG: hypothetical protein ACTSRQ_13720 [Candidatus Thorarchaeota archaeon]
MEKLTFVLFPDDKEEIGWSEDVANLGYIDRKPHRYVFCVHLLDDDYKELSIEEKECNGILYIDESFIKNGEKRCGICSRTVYLSDKRESKTAYEITFRVSKLKHFIEQSLEDFQYDMEYLDNLTWKIVIGQRITYVSILDFASLYIVYNLIKSDNLPMLGIVCNKMLELGNLAELPVCRQINIEKILHDSEILRRTIEACSSEISIDHKIEDMENLIDDLVEKITWQEFEDLIIRFENSISLNPNKTRKILDWLFSYRKILFHSVKIGGAGRPDSVRLPLYHLLKEYFELIGTIDTKRYNSKKDSQLSWSTFTDDLVMAQERNSKLIIYVTSNNISTSVWDHIFRGFRSTGSFPAIVIDRTILALLFLLADYEKLLKI